MKVVCTKLLSKRSIDGIKFTTRALQPMQISFSRWRKLSSHHHEFAPCLDHENNPSLPWLGGAKSFDVTPLDPEHIPTTLYCENSNVLYEVITTVDGVFYLCQLGLALGGTELRPRAGCRLFPKRKISGKRLEHSLTVPLNARANRRLLPHI